MSGKQRKQWGALAVMIFLGVIAQGENLVFNSGFELGNAGYQTVKYLRPDVNTAMVYEDAVPDTSTYVSGKQSLRIPNRFAEQCRVVANEVALEPNTEYTWSLWMKSSVDSCRAIISFVSATKDDWKTFSKFVDVGKAWKRYSRTFKSGPARNRYYTLQVYYCQNLNAPAADLWLDDLQINRGKLAPWSPAAKVEVAAIPKDDVNMKTENGVANTLIDLRAINYSDKPVQANLSLAAIPDHSGNYPDSARYYGDATTYPVGAVKLEPNQAQTLKTNVPLRKFGAYYVAPVVDDANVAVKIHEGYLAVLGEYKRRPIDVSKDYCVALELGTMGFSYAKNFTFRKFSFVGCSGCNPDALMDRVGQMGCRLARCHGWPSTAFIWQHTEPEQGKFNFALEDKLVDLSMKHGIELMPVLGRVAVKIQKDKTRYGLPEWVMKISEMGEVTPYLKQKGFERYYFPIAPWRDYVHAIAERYKGKINYYEIMNEPNLSMDANQYEPYLKSAHETIKAIDPKAKIIGFCSTGDLGGKVGEFLVNCFKLGALKYADIVSFHPYDAPNLSSPTTADAQIQYLFNLIAKYSAKRYPLWQTELYYYTGLALKNPKSHYSERGLFEPQDAVQRFLLDQGEGVGQSIGAGWEQFFKQPLTPHFISCSGVTSYLPNSAFVAYNALARLFEGAKPAGKIRWGMESICYVYERDGHYLAAFWNYGEAKDVTLSLSLTDTQAQLYDLYGNPLALAKQPLSLTGKPFYLRWKGADKAEFVKILKNASLNVENPIVPAIVRLLPEAKGKTIAAVCLHNRSKEACSGFVGVEAEGVISADKKRFNVGSGQDEVVMIPVNVKPGQSTTATTRVYLNDKLRSFSTPMAKLGNVSVVTRQQSAPEKLTEKDRSEAKLPATCATRYDDSKLYLNIHVTDATPSGPAGKRQPWEQDCVELFFDAAPDLLPHDHPWRYHDRVARMFILPQAKRSEQLIIWPGSLSGLTTKAVTMDTKNNTDGYDINMEIPLSALGVTPPVAGKRLGFDISIDDANGADTAKSKRVWNSADKAYRDRCDFGFLVFE